MERSPSKFPVWYLFKFMCVRKSVWVRFRIVCEQQNGGSLWQRFGLHLSDGRMASRMALIEIKYGVVLDRRVRHKKKQITHSNFGATVARTTYERI